MILLLVLQVTMQSSTLTWNTWMSESIILIGDGDCIQIGFSTLSQMLDFKDKKCFTLEQGHKSHFYEYLEVRRLLLQFDPIIADTN